MSPKSSFDTRIGPFTANISKLLSDSPSLDQKLAGYIPDDSRKSNIHDFFSGIKNKLDSADYSERIQNQKSFVDLRDSSRRKLSEEELANISKFEKRLTKLQNQLHNYTINREGLSRDQIRCKGSKLIKLRDDFENIFNFYWKELVPVGASGKALSDLLTKLEKRFSNFARKRNSNLQSLGSQAACEGGRRIRKSRKRINHKRNCRKSRKRTDCKWNCRKSRKS